jgi:hypothetical protein
VFAQLVADLDAFAGDPNRDALVSNPHPEIADVVGLVPVQFVGPAAPGAAPRFDAALVQSVKRRCAVGTVTPNDGGRSRHAHPLVSTNTIAVNTARSSTGSVPPPCGRA